MTTFILAILFCFIACLESTAYGIYEIKVNKNKAAGFLIILLSIMFIGGCAGSTGGGLKVSRFISLLKLAILLTFELLTVTDFKEGILLKTSRLKIFE